MNKFGVLLIAAVGIVAVSGSAVYPVHHGPATTQYHAQDEWGQYAYGYSGGPSAKHEQRTADGVTRGGYSYVDANGLVQSVAYVSDPVNGFRASGTNLPVDTAAAHPVPVAAAHPIVPVVHDAAVPVYAAPAPVPSWTVAAEPAAALPTIVDARHLAVPVHHAAPVHHVAPVHPLLKISSPLTPAGTANLHYPEHAVILAARKKRSVGAYPYPLLSGYRAPAHLVTVKHAEYAAPPAPIVHHAATAYVAVPAPAVAPIATSYTSVVRHDPAPVAPAVYSYAPAAPVVQHYAAPSVVVPAPVEVPHVYAAAVAPVVKSQYHSQDEHGQYTYGYTDGASAKTETRYADGETKGSYSYVDDKGAVQAVHYSAGADGFKAAGTNIPVHHV